MFARRFFPARHFPGRYFPPPGGERARRSARPYAFERQRRRPLSTPLGPALSSRA